LLIFQRFLLLEEIEEKKLENNENNNEMDFNEKPKSF